LRNRSSLIRRILFVSLLLGLILMGLGWANYRFSLNNPGGNDFLVHYIGTRAVLFDGISPYSDQVAEQIQTAAYGRPAQEGEHELRVAYPLYSVAVFTPFSLINDYPLARAVWMTALEISLLAMTFVLFNLLDWEPDMWVQGGLLFFSLTWYHAVRGLINGNAVILITLLISLVFLALKKGQDQAAGVMLAVTTIKPHLLILLIPYLIIWSVYQRRWKFISWFFGSLAGLIFGGMLLIPNWILQNIWEILHYPSYNPAGTLGEVLAGWLPGIAGQIRWGVTLTLTAVLLYEWWTTRRGDFPRFLWTGMLILAVTQWIGIQTDPGNFIMLFPALLMILAAWEKRWKKSGSWVIGLALALLLGGLWLLFALTVEESYQPVQHPIMFIPLPAFILIGLYWIKWWYVLPVREIWDG